MDRILDGVAKLGFLYAKQIREYLHRLKMAGIDRADRMRIPMELPSA